MKKGQRLKSIQSRLRAEPREWSVDELAGLFNVSPLTIRRDLDVLARRKQILRTYGGCVVNSQIADSPYYRRISDKFELKSSIGCTAAGQVHPGETILINDGSTCFHLASNLGECGPVSVYTNSIPMISELTRFQNIRVFLLGGEYDRGLFYLVGGMMERMLEMLDFDTVFLGADGIDREGRCMSGDADVARVTQMMLRRGKRSVLLADHTKLGAGGNVAYADLKDFDLWITTPGLPGKDREKIKSMTTLLEAQTCQRK